MNRVQVKELIDRYLRGECTSEEKLLLEKFYQEESAKRNLPVDEIDFEKTREEIWAATQRELTKAPPSYTSGRILAAASVILIMGVSLWLYTSNTKTGLPVIKTAKHIQQFEPAKQKAMLTLADGSAIALDDVANGTLSSQAGNQVVKMEDGSIVYKGAGAGEGNSNKLSYNTLSTPRGGYYHLTLSDGTNVWLNSASSIIYPASFSGNERIVTITGEAYFEVAKNKNKPFLVKSGDQTIRVLGTHFNVLAYKEEAAIVTTLLEGSVRIKRNNIETLLKPGQEASTTRNSDVITVSPVNKEDAVAWKNGYFKFNNESLEIIVNRISRWYDVDIEIDQTIKEKRFWGTYSQSKSLLDLLNNLQQTGDIHFRIDGRRVIIMK